MKILLTLTMVVAMAIGFLGCKSTPEATSDEPSTFDKSVPARIADDAISVGEGTVEAVGVGIDAVGAGIEAVGKVLGGDDDKDDDGETDE